MEETQGFKKYSKNISFLLFERIFRLAMSFFVSVYVIRFLGPTKYGLFSFCASFISIIITFTALGMHTIIVRELVSSPKTNNAILGTSFTLRFIACLLGYIGIFIYSQVSDQFDELEGIHILAMSLIPYCLTNIDCFFQSKVQSKFVVYTQLLQLTISSILKIIAVINNLNLTYFFYINVFDALFYAIGLIYFYEKNGYSIFKWRFCFNTCKKILSSSWPLFLSTISMILYLRIDQLMITKLVGHKQVGYYASAVKINEAWYFLPQIITGSVFPSIIQSYQNLHLYKRRLQALFDLLTVIGIIIPLLLTLLSPIIIHVILGKSYHQSSTILSVLAWSGLFNAFNLISNKRWQVESLETIIFVRSIQGLIINILLNFLLIPTYGAIGAAVATLLTHIVTYFVLDITSKKTRIDLSMKLKSLNIINSTHRLWKIWKSKNI